MAEASAPETLLDTAAAAQRLGVSESFLAKARMNGTGPRYRKLAARSVTPRLTSTTGLWRAAAAPQPNGNRACWRSQSCSANDKCTSMAVHHNPSLIHIVYREQRILE
jgi:hypothetical protein